jgi:hypothetical protein
MLIDQGDIVLIADSQGVRDIYSADGNSIDKSTPLVVLVNKGTASASEVRVRVCFVQARGDSRLTQSMLGRARTAAARVPHKHGVLTPAPPSTHSFLHTHRCWLARSRTASGG